MKSITATLIATFFIPITAVANTPNPDLGYIVEVCQKAFPQGGTEAAACVLKAAGLDGPPPTQETLTLLYGPPDDPIRVQELHSNWTRQLEGHSFSYAACNEQPNFHKCMIEAASQELAIHEKLMESIKPAAWPKNLALRFTKIHAIRMDLRGILQCESVVEPEKPKCLKKVDEENYFMSSYGTYLNKVKERMEQAMHQQAAHRRELLSREQQLRHEESRIQRAHELELARIQALGMILGSGGLQFQPPQSQLYTPPPPIPAPEIPKTRNCTSSVIGNQVYTNCY